MIPYNKLQQGVKDLCNNFKTLKKASEEDNKMERFPMLMNRKNRYCENGYTTKGDIQIQCNPNIKIPLLFTEETPISFHFTEIEKRILEFILKDNNPRTPKVIPHKKNNTRAINISDQN